MQIYRRLGSTDAMAARRDHSGQEGQRLAVAELAQLGQKTRKQIERPIGLGDEARERLPPVTTLHIVAAFDQRAARGVGLVGRRQEGQRYIDRKSTRLNSSH